MTRTTDGRGRERRTGTILPSVLSAREHGCPPPPPDRLPPRRGGRSSPRTYAVSAAGRPAGLARPRTAPRGLVRSTRALAAAALLALSGALALPAAAQAQEISLVSNIRESPSGLLNVFPPDYTIGTIEIGEKRGAQRFTTGPNPAGYTLQSVVLNLLAGSGTGLGSAGSDSRQRQFRQSRDPAGRARQSCRPNWRQHGHGGEPDVFGSKPPLTRRRYALLGCGQSNTTTITNANFDISLTRLEQ